jgi:hypothetical protein
MPLLDLLGQALRPAVVPPSGTQNRAFKLGGIGSPCCCAGGCACPTTICIEGCAGGIPGSGYVPATITVGSLPSQTTDATGCATFCLDSIGGAGSYLVKAVIGGVTCFSATESLVCHGSKVIDLGLCGCSGASIAHGSWVFTFNRSGPITCTFPVVSGSGTCFAIGSFQFTNVGSCLVNVNNCGTFPLLNTSTCSPLNFKYNISFSGCGAFPGDTIVGVLTATP